MRIRNRIADFVAETGIRHSILATLITTFGLRQSPYSSVAQVELTMDDLFAWSSNYTYVALIINRKKIMAEMTDLDTSVAFSYEVFDRQLNNFL